MIEKDVPDQSNDKTRIDRLNKRLAQAKQVEDIRTAKNEQGVDANYKLGNRVLADLIAGIAGGALLGWFVDRIFNTSPWGLLGLLFLGTIVAFRNIIRLGTTPTDKT